MSASESQIPRVMPLDLSHLDQIVEIEQSAYEAPWSRELLAESLRAPMTHSLGVFESSQLMAYSIYQLIFSEGHLLNIAVSPQFRGRGLGRRLLSELLEMAKENGALTFFLEVRPTNEVAKRLYESFGFKSLMLREKYYSDGEAALIMVKDMLRPVEKA